MVSSMSIALAATSLVVSVAAHGNVTFPAARVPGPAMLAACGSKAVQSVLSDGTIPLEDVLNATKSCKEA